MNGYEARAIERLEEAERLRREDSNEHALVVAVEAVAFAVLAFMGEGRRR